jgi:hypothetical protein
MLHDIKNQVILVKRDEWGSLVFSWMNQQTVTEPK